MVELYCEVTVGYHPPKAGKGGDGTGTRMPEVVRMLNSPGMTNALNAIMGEGWAVVPFIHSGFGGSGNNDQTW